MSLIPPMSFEAFANAKGQKSQLARMIKASLPNEWSCELAEEVVRDYVQGNFADKGMYADWAIHDCENDKGQHNRQQSKTKRREKFNEKAIEM